MKALLSIPLDQTLTDWWVGLDPSCKNAFLFTLCVSLLAFGFEMTNLSMIHDDVAYIFLESSILGHYMGRFGFGWLHYYTQSAFLMPFLQMAEGLVLMALYGMVVARFWGARKTLDLTLIASVVCVFPYMAQLYQFNVSMAPFPAAHLLSVLAVVLSIRAKLLPMALAVLLYAAAFSIYQTVIANAVTILGVWVLCKLLFAPQEVAPEWRAPVKSMAAALCCLAAGGALYVAAVHFMGLKIDDPRQAADEAFRLGGLFNSSAAIEKVVTGTRAFYVWPESYFPGYLKALQLALVAVAAILCIALPRRWSHKLLALVVLGAILLAPRTLQMVHPAGHYTNRTLTAYALVIAGIVTLIHRGGPTLVRNLSSIAVAVLLWGYILQCNWIATVNHMNTLAHFSAVAQVLDTVRAVAHDRWDGTKVTVVGRLDMSARYPYRQSDGVASEYLDGEHMQQISLLLRTGVTFTPDDGTNPQVREFAATRRAWPHPESVTAIDGKGVVVLSSEHLSEDRARPAPSRQ